MSTESTAILAPAVENTPCARCGALLASDQRYCLECGTRRTEARSQFLDSLAPAHAPPADPPLRPPGERSPGEGTWHGGSVWAGATSIAAVGVLLLAMGVGILIGRSGSSKTVTAPAQTVSLATPAAVPGAGTLSSPSAATGTPAAFSDDWPSGRNGYTVQLQSLQAAGTQPAEVAAAKAAATAKGAREVGALSSNDYRGLPSGLYVIYSGIYSTAGQAGKAIAALKKSFPAAAVTHVDGAAGSGGSSAAGSGSGGSAGAGGAKGAAPAAPSTPSSKGTSAPGSGQGNEQKSLHLPDVVSTG